MLNNLITANIAKFNANEASQVLNLLNTNKLTHYHSGDYVLTYMIGLNLLRCPDGTYEEIQHTPEFQAHYAQFERIELNFIHGLIQDINDQSGDTLTVNDELPYTYIITGPSDEGFTCTIMLTGSCIMISIMHGCL